MPEILEVTRMSADFLAYVEYWNLLDVPHSATEVQTTETLLLPLALLVIVMSPILKRLHLDMLDKYINKGLTD